MIKNQFKYVLLIIFFALLCVIPNYAEAGTIYNTNNLEYEITSYNVTMVVNEDNTFDITEDIVADFNVLKHGIYRKIPLRNYIERLDGTKSSNRAEITNISVSEEFSSYTQNGYKVLKIGNPYNAFTGTRSYKIKYTYNIGKDPLKDADELYYNLIGTEWDTSIQNVTFKIIMPKEFDNSQLGFSSGYEGQTNGANVYYTISGNMITGKVDRTLLPGQGVTVRLTLPEGYFVGAKTDIDMFSLIVMGISVLSVAITIQLWNKYGKDNPVIEIVEFYPPEEYNSAEVGYLYEGCATTEGAISLLIYLANKGYLKIEERKTLGILSVKNDFNIIKLKEYDGDNENEKLFFDGLFKNSDSKSADISSVSGDDLYDSFYKTLDKIKANLSAKENKNKIFETAGSGLSKWIIFMIVAIFLLITIKPVLPLEEGIALFCVVVIFSGTGFTVLILLVFGRTSLYNKFFGLVWGGMFGGMPWVAIVLPQLLQEPMYLITYIVGIICMVILAMLFKAMPKRTPYGNEILGRIRGFKRFLENAEKEELEKLVYQNPEYFFDILPYTYALGVSDVWISQFESIALQAPNWYDSSSRFDIHSFGTFMSNTMSSATTAMSSSPSSGGGSSGGGSSGGGSGGGGGGSW